MRLTFIYSTATSRVRASGTAKLAGNRLEVKVDVARRQRKNQEAIAAEMRLLPRRIQLGNCFDTRATGIAVRMRSEGYSDCRANPRRTLPGLPCETLRTLLGWSLAIATRIAMREPPDHSLGCCASAKALLGLSCETPPSLEAIWIAVRTFPERYLDCRVKAFRTLLGLPQER